MSFIIIGSTAWGLLLGEWRTASPKAFRLLLIGGGMLVLATVLVGVGNRLGT